MLGPSDGALSGSSCVSTKKFTELMYDKEAIANQLAEAQKKKILTTEPLLNAPPGHGPIS